MYLYIRNTPGIVIAQDAIHSACVGDGLWQWSHPLNTLWNDITMAKGGQT